MTAKIYRLEEARDKFYEIKKGFYAKNKVDDLIWFAVDSCLKNGMPDQDVYSFLEELAVLCDPVFIKQEIKDKIEKSIEIWHRDGKEINLARQVRDFIVSTNGHFLSTDVHKELNVSTRRHKKTISEILRRLIEEGIIERYGNKNGCFRLIDKTLEKIDWKKANGNEFDVLLPFNLNELVRIYPKNLIVIAGMSNAGKTALLLNIVGMNLDLHKGRINYFSSEMSEDELKNRLLSFGLGEELWDNCNFYERTIDFCDVIRPNEINIVDYLEKYNDFFEVGKDLKNIYDKLDKGIAIVALQKNADRDDGVGGRFTREKARVYLSVNEIGNENEIKIVKGKSWKNKKYNPNGLIKRFKIEEGYKLIELGNWGRKEIS